MVGNEKFIALQKPLAELEFLSGDGAHFVTLARDPQSRRYVVTADAKRHPQRGENSLFTFFVDRFVVSDTVCTVRATRILGGLYERYSITATRRRA